MFFKLTRDDISPAIRRLVKLARNPEPVMRAMGTTFKSITEGNFNSVGAAMRPSPWASKADGSPSNLQRSTTLSKSFRLDVSPTVARLSNPARYAAIHQFGGEITAKRARMLSWIGPDGQRVFVRRVTIPARPFFPVDATGSRLTRRAEELILRAGERMVQRQTHG